LLQGYLSPRNILHLHCSTASLPPNIQCPKLWLTLFNQYRIKQKIHSSSNFQDSTRELLFSKGTIPLWLIDSLGIKSGLSLYLEASPPSTFHTRRYDHYITKERGLISLLQLISISPQYASISTHEDPLSSPKHAHDTRDTKYPHLSPAISTSIHRTMLSNAGASNRMPGHQEFRHMSTGSLNIPPGGLNGSTNGPPPHMGAMSRFDGPRSPPGKQSQFEMALQVYV
jgi:hypothetical protein